MFLDVSSETRHNHQSVAEQVARMAIDALRYPQAAIADLFKPAQSHEIRDHTLNASSTILRSLGFKPNGVN